jgi:mRNA interferase RelE/StbE
MTYNWMTYKLKFKKQALREWRKLDDNLRAQFKKKLLTILECPCLPGARLYGSDNRYKIKLRNAGYRLVYEVRKEEIVIVVIAIGRRDRGAIYKTAAKR